MTRCLLLCRRDMKLKESKEREESSDSRKRKIVR